MDQQQQQRVVGQPVRPPVQQAPAAPAKKPKSLKKLWIIIVSIVIVLAALGILGKVFLGGASKVDSSRYQAVFLSNGQVYFGKLHDYYSDHPYLTDVYYIQSNTADASADTATSNTTNDNQQLVKLGNEIHGPDAEMILNKDSVLFVENLKNDSKVVKLIQDSNKK